MIDLARKNLLSDKLRFVITISGVAFAVTLVLVQVGLFLGILRNASITIDRMNADLWISPRNTANVDFAHDFPESRVQRVRSVPGVARADNLIVTFMNVSLPTGATEATVVYALENFGRWNLPWRVSEGSPKDLRGGRYVMVDASASKRFGPFAVGDYREYMGKRLKIIGRTEEARSFTTTPLSFMDYHLAQELQPQTLTCNTTYILVKLASGANLEQVRREIARRLPYNDVHTRGEWSAQSRGYWIKSTGIGLNMIVTVFLGCLVGIVVVAQTLYTSTVEHLKEFGTLKAIGGSNRDIYGILGRQAVIAAVCGFVLGILPAYALGPLVERGGLKLIIPPSFAVVVFVGTVAMCVVAAMVSFRKVARIDPLLVFRT